MDCQIIGHKSGLTGDCEYARQGGVLIRDPERWERCLQSLKVTNNPPNINFQERNILVIGRQIDKGEFVGLRKSSIEKTEGILLCEVINPFMKRAYATNEFGVLVLSLPKDSLPKLEFLRCPPLDMELPECEKRLTTILAEHNRIKFHDIKIMEDTRKWYTDPESIAAVDKVIDIFKKKVDELWIQVLEASTQLKKVLAGPEL